MDLYEMHRETVAEITSAWRAAGYEPWGVSVHRGNYVSVTVETPDWQYPRVQTLPAGDVLAVVDGEDVGVFITVEQAVEHAVECVTRGVVAKRADDAWAARRARHTMWFRGATRDEAIAAALAVQP